MVKAPASAPREFGRGFDGEDTASGAGDAQSDLLIGHAGLESGRSVRARIESRRTPVGPTSTPSFMRNL